MSATLQGRSALVTGGLSGMGLEIARALAGAGADVAVGSYLAASPPDLRMPPTIRQPAKLPR